jgi:hypothetical protein
MPESFSSGTIGGLGRSILVRGRKYENMLQMSGASIRRLRRLRRRLGRPADRPDHSAAAETRQRQGRPALAFAVPAAWVKFSADRIIEHGRMVRGWLGASLLPLRTPRAQLASSPARGAEVARVDRDSPAAKAGLATRILYLRRRPGDLDALQWKMARSKPTPSS